MAGLAGRRVGKLTARTVETMKKPGLIGDGGGLYLKIDDGGSKSWIFRHQTNGKVRKYGLGPVITVGLADARQRAEAIRRQLLDGIDPREARRKEAVAEAKSISFDDATAAYIKSHQAGWKSDKHAAQWKATLLDLRLPGIRQAAGERHRHRHGDAGAGADLDQQELKRRRAFVAGSKAFSAGPMSTAIATDRTRHSGATISTICCLQSPRCRK